MVDNPAFRRPIDVDSLNMIGVVAAPSVMLVLNNKPYSSSFRFYHFIKYSIFTNNTFSKLKPELAANLAVINLTRPSYTYANTSDHTVETMIKSQLQIHSNDWTIRKKFKIP